MRAKVQGQLHFETSDILRYFELAGEYVASHACPKFQEHAGKFATPTLASKLKRTHMRERETERKKEAKF